MWEPRQRRAKSHTQSKSTGRRVGGSLHETANNKRSSSKLCRGISRCKFKISMGSSRSSGTALCTKEHLTVIGVCSRGIHGADLAGTDGVSDGVSMCVEDSPAVAVVPRETVLVLSRTGTDFTDMLHESPIMTVWKCTL